ncbi:MULTISPECIES: RNA polymerase sigma factor [Alteromonadaceae]|jgi:RNA polymerase sigma-70 factor (ECF subfamily)|uniref:RNA polymerase sigma factor n=1 Tax=Brumicola blandensis TaxID=3075611 RepID=A0AAW8R4X8_9ALTE|nr:MULTISPECIES: RNA polymerase sigma factor [unclassified Alteromonas]MDT0583484.1 RNA polymerase sigma factor [Alteromonas sp. W409]MDT0629419.1 RNA polymerase sigma factor [Alteromonas sp. W364]
MPADLTLIKKQVSRSSEQQVEETQLIAAAKQQDVKAFKALYDQYLNMVYGLCLRLCADKSLAEDATQEVFIQLWRKIDNFDGNSQFSTWLHSVTSNVTISYIRKQRGWWQKMINIEQSSAFEEVTYGCLEDVQLEKYIYKLPERARWVFVLHALEGYRHEEIAKTLGMAVGSSKAQFHRAKNLLQGWISDEQ